MRVTISYSDTLHVEVEHDMDRPDLLSDMSARALDLWTQAYAVVRASEASVEE